MPGIFEAYAYQVLQERYQAAPRNDQYQRFNQGIWKVKRVYPW